MKVNSCRISAKLLHRNTTHTEKISIKSNSLHKKWSFQLRISSVNVTFTEQTFNGFLHFLCSESIANKINDCGSALTHLLFPHIPFTRVFLQILLPFFFQEKGRKNVENVRKVKRTVKWLEHTPVGAVNVIQKQSPDGVL